MNKFFESISSYFKNCQERKRKNIEIAREYEIKRLFNVVERSGNLYLVCDGNAIAKIADDKTAKEIVESINASRKAHKDYNSFKTEENDNK